MIDLSASGGGSGQVGGGDESIASFPKDSYLLVDMPKLRSTFLERDS
jgi:hypothetical protein